MLLRGFFVARVHASKLII